MCPEFPQTTQGSAWRELCPLCRCGREGHRGSTTRSMSPSQGGARPLELGSSSYPSAPWRLVGLREKHGKPMRPGVGTLEAQGSWINVCRVTGGPGPGDRRAGLRAVCWAGVGWVVSRAECFGRNEGNMEAGVGWDSCHVGCNPTPRRAPVWLPQPHPPTHCAVWTWRPLRAGLSCGLDGLRGQDPRRVSHGGDSWAPFTPLLLLGPSLTLLYPQVVGSGPHTLW